MNGVGDAKEFPVKRLIWDSGLEIDKSDFTQVFSACVGWVMNTQMAASELVVRGQQWDMNFELGSIFFGEDRYLLQLIGSEDKTSNTWLWGWANPSEIPQLILESSQQLQKWGEANGLALFTKPEHEIDAMINGHTLSIVATALEEEAACYYRGLHDAGAVFVSFTGVPAQVFAPIGAQRFAGIANQIIAQFTVNHKIMVQSFLYQNGTPYQWQGNALQAAFDGEGPVNIVFDDMERIANIQFTAQN